MIRAAFLVSVSLGLLLSVLPVRAAPLTFTSSTPIVLTSPSTTLTIASGSVADSLTVNATSVVVDLSASTGGSFTLLSPNYHLDVATSSTGGTVTYTCVTTGTSTLTFAQLTGSTTYTVTPTTAACPTVTSSSAPLVTAVGGSYPPPSFLVNGGASSTDSTEVTLTFAAPPTVSSFAITTTYEGAGETATTSYASTLSLNLCASLSSCTTGTYTISIDFLDASGVSVGNAAQSIDYMGAETVSPTVATSSLPSTGSAGTATSTMTISQLESLLASLQAEFQTLLKEAAARDIVVQGAPASATSSSTYAFIRNLQRWDEGIDVNELQRYLVAQDSGPAAQALARHGATDVFGLLTYRALVEFQKAVGIAPASGYFGPITRRYIEGHEE